MPGAALAVLVAAGLAAASGTQVRFRFRAPEAARTVSVTGTFNSWDTRAAPMADPDGDGVWETVLSIPQGRHQYKFVVNGATWFTDETASAFADDGFGGRNSVLEVGAQAVSVGEKESEAAAPTGTLVTFRFRPAGAGVHAVSVAGSFNDWNAAAHTLTDADGDGVWQVSLRLAPGFYAYQFVVNGDRWFTDATAAGHEDDGFGGRNALLRVGTEPIVTRSR